MVTNFLNALASPGGRALLSLFYWLLFAGILVYEIHNWPRRWDAREKAPIMGRWQSFLNSLSTPGGNVAILVLIVMLLAIDATFFAKGDANVGDALKAFGGALLLALRGRSTDPGAQVPNTTVSTVTSTVGSPTPPDGAQAK